MGTLWAICSVFCRSKTVLKKTVYELEKEENVYKDNDYYAQTLDEVTTKRYTSVGLLGASDS